MTVYYDNWCKNCSRFMRLIHNLDWLKLVSSKELRNESHTKNVDGLDVVLAEEQLASVSNDKWKYGYDSLYRVFARIPLFWMFLPFFWLLKITRLGQYLYMQLAVNRQVIPLHCGKENCEE